MPEIRPLGDDFLVTWEDYAVEIEYHNIHEDKAGVHAEVRVRSTNPAIGGSLLWERVNLMAGQTRSSAAKRIAERWSGEGAPPWDTIMVQGAYFVVQAFREGEPFTTVGAMEWRESPRYRLDPLLPEGQISVLFGDGGVGKSALATALGLAIHTSAAPLQFPTQQGNVLYLDWETSRAEVDDRLKRIWWGWNLENIPTFGYRNCFRPLHMESEIIRKNIARDAIQFVVVDSLGMAIGADPNDMSDVIRTFTAMRSFGCTVLAIDHVAKADSEGKPIGSVYKYNYARSVWELRKEPGISDSQLTVALLHRKANQGKLQQPMAFTFIFDGEDGPIAISRSSMEQAGLIDYVATPKRIHTQLARGPLSLSNLLAELPDIKESAINSAIARMKARQEIHLMGGKWALTDSTPAF